MVNFRRVLLVSGEIYHIYNRGIERRTIFSNKREYQRALDTINYYRFSNLPVRLSHFFGMKNNRRKEIIDNFKETEVTIIAYCLMPNHFHLMLKQEKENGISKFIANICNSYSKYFNTKKTRSGPLFQGPFKAVRVETNEQLLHLSRYVHLNPVSSFLIKETELDDYEWSSLPEYIKFTDRKIVDPALVLNQFKNKEEYRLFVHNQIQYAQELEKVKHLTLEEV
ncbi:MAG: hypothetical protein UV73_C0010G0027 [Candidatus Gottesmanbacteria bacterium GW2011_GWA2_43_14]|uniref:Transposase IS200-like domain-containing protein n=1 Tax=Candidatus Gottesmanbacteria bacterium GW2011_GWA2_43_14 TaxID=1618443 RepID=A0A0G1DFQ5_9BACT|nr:MAG: hypothetical protein UV73_C0010G0027 [Candidatus Gottesmanbacteria bacterium GW2011_GWA2_43_14]